LESLKISTQSKGPGLTMKKAKAKPINNNSSQV
jgi:hypothetical protein